jgi:hypothetical protein
LQLLQKIADKTEVRGGGGYEHLTYPSFALVIICKKEPVAIRVKVAESQESRKSQEHQTPRRPQMLTPASTQGRPWALRKQTEAKPLTLQLQHVLKVKVVSPVSGASEQGL